MDEYDAASAGVGAPFGLVVVLVLPPPPPLLLLPPLLPLDSAELTILASRAASSGESAVKRTGRLEVSSAFTVGAHAPSHPGLPN